MTLLSKADIATINRTRSVLSRIAALGPESYSQSGEFGGGKLDEACEAAERALQNVLIVARVFVGVSVSDKDISVQEER
jgi:hypothetical protein